MVGFCLQASGRERFNLIEAAGLIDLTEVSYNHVMTKETIEAQVLREMRSILTEIARETAVHRGARHVLSDDTIVRMRDCLSLISAREKELNEARGVEMTSRPKLGVDKSDSVRVQLKKSKSGTTH